MFTTRQSVMIKFAKGVQKPSYESRGAAGMDVRAHLGEYPDIPGFIPPVTISPGERVVIHTGIHVAVPQGYEIQVRPRSGLAAKAGVTVLNTPGTIDSDYRGEIMVILINLGLLPFTINHGDRVAQLVLAPVVHCDWFQLDDDEQLPSTDRGARGIGSTGKA